MHKRKKARGRQKTPKKGEPHNQSSWRAKWFLRAACNTKDTYKNMEERAAERPGERQEAEGALHVEQARRRQGRWWAPTRPPRRKGTATAGKSAGEEVPD